MSFWEWAQFVHVSYGGIVHCDCLWQKKIPKLSVHIYLDSLHNFPNIVGCLHKTMNAKTVSLSIGPYHWWCHVFSLSPPMAHWTILLMMSYKVNQCHKTQIQIATCTCMMWHCDIVQWIPYMWWPLSHFMCSLWGVKDLPFQLYTCTCMYTYGWWCHCVIWSIEHLSSLSFLLFDPEAMVPVPGDCNLSFL